MISLAAALKSALEGGFGSAGVLLLQCCRTTIFEVHDGGGDFHPFNAQVLWQCIPAEIAFVLSTFGSIVASIRRRVDGLQG